MSDKQIINGTLYTRENNNFSLSCWADMTIRDGIVVDKHYKGMPRPNKDYWFRFYEKKQRGDVITQDEIKRMLSCDGSHNIRSFFVEGGDE